MSAVKKLSTAFFSITVVAALFMAPLASAVPPGTADEIRDRMQPVGSLCRAGDDCGTTVAVAASGPMSGEDVYNQYCFACHAAGVSGAPMLGNAEQWGPRVDKGMEALMQSTLNGINAMPAKGTCASCSDEELQAAVEHMLP